MVEIIRLHLHQEEIQKTEVTAIDSLRKQVNRQKLILKTEEVQIEEMRLNLLQYKEQNHQEAVLKADHTNLDLKAPSVLKLQEQVRNLEAVSRNVRAVLAQEAAAEEEVKNISIYN